MVWVSIEKVSIKKSDAEPKLEKFTCLRFRCEFTTVCSHIIDLSDHAGREQIA